jgi:hypothetical protein
MQQEKHSHTQPFSSAVGSRCYPTLLLPGTVSLHQHWPQEHLGGQLEEERVWDLIHICMHAYIHADPKNITNLFVTPTQLTGTPSTHTCIHVCIHTSSSGRMSRRSSRRSSRKMIGRSSNWWHTHSRIRAATPISPAIWGVDVWIGGCDFEGESR